ncbi:uncharacterized protein GIQ15_02507 [Arthroderma uncinatum]|uniref:uncharacterized protein n=1 Tax=Arthroderma uncinatum TaxID=74035 RepID=UPI00144AC11E|nr:uncharacterized protein GIQ15_02507 [Arthroderma uncinatum]KAF3483183.1 hypothetical protein GIQ15_02507 [Arthroderma uncinatum]
MPSLGLREIEIERVDIDDGDEGATAAAFNSTGESSGSHSPPRIAILITTVIAVIIVGVSLFLFVRWRTRRGQRRANFTRRRGSDRTGTTEIIQKQYPLPSGKGSKSPAQGGLEWNPESTFAKPSAVKAYMAPYTHSQAMLSSSSIKRLWHNSIGATRAPKLQVRTKLSSPNAENELEGLSTHHREDSGGNPLLEETVTEIEAPPRVFTRTLSTQSSSIFHLDRPSVDNRPVSTSSTLDQTPRNVPSTDNSTMISKYPWPPTTQTNMTPVEPSYNSMTFFNHRESYGTQDERITIAETTTTASRDRPPSHLHNS